MTSIAENIAAVSSAIREQELAYGRRPNSVCLLAVSKRHSCASIRAARAAGQRDFGENYVSEALEKMQQLPDLDAIWHFIGPIQSNKTASIATFFDWVHGLDRLKIAERLSRQRPSEREPLNVCIQVNLSRERSKSGVDAAQTRELAAQIMELPNLRLRGLMAIPAPQADPELQRIVFRELKQLFDELATELEQSRVADLDTLSMGMSGDYPAAIAEGSTLVRVGTAIFGRRRD